ncbi:MAG TPA: hypothetical protein VKT72_00710 [Candidatus Baltobacteraceae bacterium]|nr:hypothetical protein [Candidatus Baltobacteraceae bacterium]
MSSRAILGFASAAGLLVSLAVPAIAQTTPPTTPTTPTTPMTQPATTTPTTTNSKNTTNCPKQTTTTNPNSSTPNTQTSTNGSSTTTTSTCPNMQPAPASPAMQNGPVQQPQMNALTGNPNGPDWLAKYNRPNVMQNNYLGTTSRPHRMMQRCRYVMERGVRTKICR